VKIIFLSDSYTLHFFIGKGQNLFQIASIVIIYHIDNLIFVYCRSGSSEAESLCLSMEISESSNLEDCSSEFECSEDTAAEDGISTDVYGYTIANYHALCIQSRNTVVCCAAL